MRILHIVIYAVIAYNIHEVKNMYKKMYLLLFNAITNALKEKDIDTIRKILIKAQTDAEKICMDSNEEI